MSTDQRKSFFADLDCVRRSWFRGYRCCNDQLINGDYYCGIWNGGRNSGLLTISIPLTDDEGRAIDYTLASSVQSSSLGPVNHTCSLINWKYCCNINNNCSKHNSTRCVEFEKVSAGLSSALLTQKLSGAQIHIHIVFWSEL